MLSSVLARRQSCLVLLGLTATALYLNTLPAGFTFDDNFAVVRHGLVYCISALILLPCSMAV